MRKIVLVFFMCILTIGLVAPGVFDTAYAADKNKYGGVLKWATSLSPINFGDPVKIRGGDQSPAAPALEFLMLEKRVTGEYVPLLATDWKMADDGRSMVINLRKGVTFHDGTDFNAEAVKFNLDLWLKAPGPVLKTMESVDIINDHSVRLNFSEYNALIENHLAREAYMVSPTAYEKKGEKWMGTHPIGTGPFKYKKYERDVVLSFEKNKDYWRKDRPYLDGYDLFVIKDGMTQVAALKTGEIHGMNTFNRQAIPGLVKSGFKLRKAYGAAIGMYGDSIHPDSPWANKKVREAIEYAIDKDTIVNDLGLGFFEALYQAVPAGNPMYNPGLKPRKYDPEKAKQLLKDAGFPKGFKTSYTAASFGWFACYVAIQSYLADVGIDLEIIPVDRAKFGSILFRGGLKDGASYMMQDQLTDNLTAGLSNVLMSSSKIGRDMLRPKGFDDLMGNVLIELDAAKRKEMLFQATKMLYDDVSYIPLYQDMRTYVTSTALHDWDPNVTSIPEMGSLTNAWLEK